MERYTIGRFYHNGRKNEVQKTGVTLEAAQAHCRSAESLGPGWFDVYDLDRHWRDFARIVERRLAKSRKEKEITRCPICGGGLQSTTEIWRSGVRVHSDGYILSDGELYDKGDPQVYCDNDHSLDEIVARHREDQSDCVGVEEEGESVWDWIHK